MCRLLTEDILTPSTSKKKTTRHEAPWFTSFARC